MPTASDVLYYLIHYDQLRAIIQWNLLHHPVHERDEDKEPVTLRQCYHFLDKTSRSFSAVIKELHPELLVPICLFYLVLRALDTIEDDMTIALEEKDPLLRDFHTILEQDGWGYSGNHVKERDRQLLVDFHVVVTEFKKIKPVYRDIIRDITTRMGKGMADYANNAEHNVNGINTIKEYELYCHYVAGLVGEGLTRLFVESQLANPALLERTHLYDSMGQFLQQTNIIRDIREDYDDKRKFWPKEVWSKYVDKFDDLFDPKNQEAALNCTSEMVLLALSRADECLFYLAGLRDQSVFNFAAIPQSMAIATLALCFRNPDIFKRNVKITKGQACQLMVASTQNLQLVCEVFRKYTRIIHFKNDPKDPHFLSISIACGKIEQFIEHIFPSQVPGGRVLAAGEKPLSPEEEAKLKARQTQDKWDGLLFMGFLVLISLVLCSIAFGVAWLAGARFDLMFGQLFQAKPVRQVLDAFQAEKAATSQDRSEL